MDRVATLRDALDLLWTQSERDGAEPFTCIGAAKIELLRLERQIHDQDAAERGVAVSAFAREIALAPLAVKMALAGRGEG